MIEHGRTGWLVAPGDPRALVEAARRFADEPDAAREMRAGARQAFLDRYTADQNFVALMGIYERAVAERRGDANG